MFSSFIPGSVPRLRFDGWSKVISLPSVEVHNIEAGTEKRTRRLKHFIKLNHLNHSVLYHDLRFHNHVSHLLGSAYLLGSSAEGLNDCYDDEAKELEQWEDSPNEIAPHDWRASLGDKNYQRAYLDFFEDHLVLNNYDWKALANQFLFEGNDPLANWLVGGLGHPLIHLGYAFELDSRELCMESLTLAAVSYSPMHKYIDDPKYASQTPTYQTSSPREVIARIAADTRFNGVYPQPGGSDFDKLFSDPALEQAVLSHWNALTLTSPTPKAIFAQFQKLAVGILICSRDRSTHQYDFYLLHLLTTSHAIRILIPFFPNKFHLSLLQQWWFITVILYISQTRPLIDYDEVLNYDLKDRNWSFVEDMAIKGKYRTDAHYIKGLRAMKVAAESWKDEYPDVEEYYLKAAVRFADEFDGWTGF